MRKMRFTLDYRNMFYGLLNEKKKARRSSQVKRKPLREMERAYLANVDKIESLQQKNEDIIDATSTCSCGQCLARSPDTKGWLHSYEKCDPPPKTATRCYCGFVLLRKKTATWYTASYSTGDDPRMRLTHAVCACFEPID